MTEYSSAGIGVKPGPEKTKPASGAIGIPSKNFTNNANHEESLHEQPTTKNQTHSPQADDTNK